MTARLSFRLNFTLQIVAEAVEQNGVLRCRASGPPKEATQNPEAKRIDANITSEERRRCSVFEARIERPLKRQIKPINAPPEERGNAPIEGNPHSASIAAPRAGLYSGRL